MVPKFLIFTDSCLVLFGSHISPGFFHSWRIPVSHGSGFHQPSFIGIPISFGGIPKAGPGHLADTC